MNEIVYKEKLSSIRNEMTHLWTSFFIVAGGSATILFNKPDFIAGLFAVIGILISIAFLNAYMIRRNEIIKLLDKLEENSNE